MKRKDEEILKLVKQLGELKSSFEEIEEKESVIANSKRAILTKIKSVASNLELLTIFDDDLNSRK